jgi:hypothetical protein
MQGGQANQEAPMLGFELIGYGFVALFFTAMQFGWLLESAQV